MTNVDISYRLKEFSGEMKRMADQLKELNKKVVDQELWDNEDMKRFWKVSTRTLATWRADGIIGFVQVGNKIWYPREARELFLKMNYNEFKEERKEAKDE